MKNKTTLLVLLLMLLFIRPAGAQSKANEDDRAADRAAIRAHIESIFEAFINKDAVKLRATHSEDWRGFLEGSRIPIRGIDEYMKAIDGGLKNKTGGMASYKMTDFDVTFYADDLAVSCFNADIVSRSGFESKLRILDIHARRNGKWIQVSSHTVVHPEAIAQQTSMPRPVSPQTRDAILKAREAVWRAYFSNDRATLEKVIPQETIAINEGSQTWADRSAILKGAENFSASGAKLVRLEFPKTDIQIYGNTVILYTTYLYEIEKDGQRVITNGRGTEMFVQRGNMLVNVGWHLDAVK